MANKTLKIDAEIGGLRKTLKSVGDLVSGIGKKKIDIGLDPKKLKDINSQLKFQNDVLKNTYDAMDSLRKKMADTFDPERIKKYRREMAGLRQDAADAKSSMRDLSGQGRMIGGGGAGGRSGGFGGMVGGAALGGTAMIAAATWVLKGAMNAAADRVKLQGLGLNKNQIFGLEKRGTDLNYTMEQTRQSAIEMMRGTGSASALTSTQLLAKGVGADPSELIGMMGQLRGSGMSDKQSIKFLKDTFTSAVAAGFDTSRALDVLGAISANIDAISKTGGADAGGLKDAVMALMNGSSFFAQNADRSINAVAGFDKLFTGGGPASTLGYMAIKKMRQDKGLPDQSIGETMYDMSQGLFDAPDAAERLKTAIGITTNMGFPGRNIVSGGGIDQLTEAERKTLAVKVGGETGLKPSMAKASIEAYLSKEGNDQAAIFEKSIAASKDLGERTIDVLSSSDNKLLGIGVLLEQIRMSLADLTIEILKTISPFSYAGKQLRQAWGGGGTGIQQHQSYFNEMFGKNVFSNTKGNYASVPEEAGKTIFGIGKKLTSHNAPSTAGNGINFKNDSVKSGFSILQKNAPELATALSSFQDPLTLTSTFRSPSENIMAGGAWNSLHMKGKAADIRTKGMDASQINQIMGQLQEWGFKAINEGDHIHVEQRGSSEKINVTPQSAISSASPVSSSFMDEVKTSFSAAAKVWTDALQKEKDKKLSTTPILKSEVSDKATLNKSEVQ